MSRSRGILLLLTVLAALAMLQGCSLKKNTAATRGYTAFITRYNILFNGDEHYRVTMDAMERDYPDDFSRMLYVHPAEARANPEAPQPDGDFSRSAEKAEKAIRLRSIRRRPAPKPGHRNDPAYREWMKREEYNPVLHNAWMLLGRSRYADGRFLDAAATFYYVARHFQWLPQTVTEARLWMARSYIAAGWLFEAEMALASVKEKQLVTPQLRGLYNLDMASLMIRSGRYGEAIAPLRAAIPTEKGIARARLTLLLGQLYAAAGSNDSAYMAFDRVARTRGIPRRMRFNARISRSEVCAPARADSEIKSLRSLARYAVNAPDLDQIYYAIGNLSLAKADTAAAVEAYRTGIKHSDAPDADKGRLLAALGNLYYDRSLYTEAQPLLAEAMPLLPPDFKDYDRLKERSDAADRLSVFASEVTLQDSLLRHSALTPEERMETARRLAREYKDRQKRLEQEKAASEATGNQSIPVLTLQGSAAAPAAFTLNTDRAWYFYNPALRRAGSAEFQKRWGSRRPDDDWRRSDKTTSLLSSPSEPSEVPEDSEISENSELSDSPDRETVARRSDPAYPDYYLVQIPADSASAARARLTVEDGLYNMALMLKDRLGDYPAATRTFRELLRRFPATPVRLDALHNLYLLSALRGDESEAARYRRTIVEEFPESALGRDMARPGYSERLRRMAAVEDSLYNRAYAAYMADDNPTLHALYREMTADYPASRLMPKMMFLEALSYVKENRQADFASLMRRLAASYPESDVSPLASAYTSRIERGETTAPWTRNVRGIQWDTRMLSDHSHPPVAPDENQAPTDSTALAGPQTVLLVYDALTTDGNTMLFEVARFNFATFTAAGFDIEKMRFGNLGIIAVYGFSSPDEAYAYRSLLESHAPAPLNGSCVPLVIPQSEFSRMLAEGATLRRYLENAAAERLEQVHRSVLPPETYAGEAEERRAITPQDAKVETGADEAFDIPVPPPPPVMNPKKSVRRLRPARRPSSNLR